MPVRDEHGSRAHHQQRVIGQHREGKHHLVNLRFTVAPHAEKRLPVRVEQCNYALGMISRRQCISRAVVKQIAQPDQPLRPLGCKARKHLLGRPSGRRVNQKQSVVSWYPFQAILQKLSSTSKYWWIKNQAVGKISWGLGEPFTKGSPSI